MILKELVKSPHISPIPNKGKCYLDFQASTISKSTYYYIIYVKAGLRGK